MTITARVEIERGDDMQAVQADLTDRIAQVKAERWQEELFKWIGQFPGGITTVEAAYITKYAVEMREKRQKAEAAKGR